MITIELYDTKVPKGTVFLGRTYTDDEGAARFDDWKKLTTNGICHMGRRMKADVTFRDIILRVQAAGLLAYKLKDGRGMLFHFLSPAPYPPFESIHLHAY